MTNDQIATAVRDDDNAASTAPTPQVPATVDAQARDVGFPRDKVELIKRTVAKGCTDDELQLFLHIATRTGLDPFAKQIHAVKRWDRNAGREVMAVQTGIDGYRLVAERTGCYAPGREPSYQAKEDGSPLSATAYVKKMTKDGTWHEVAATAHWDEYKQTKKDGNLTPFWRKMPHVMLAKVAEALALRRAFPMELSGVYTFDEMAQAEPATGTHATSGGAGGAGASAQPPTLQQPAAQPRKEAASTGRDGGGDQKAAPASDPDRTLQPAEIKSLWTVVRKATGEGERFWGMDPKADRAQIEAAFRGYLGTTFGIESTKEIRVSQVDQIGRWLAGKEDA